MIRKNLILTGISIALALLFIATIYYPGGSQHDSNSVGYDWRNNYLSNLFNPVAINGAANPARFLAAGGMFFLCASFAGFFIGFSTRIASKTAATIIRYGGAGAMVAGFLAVTPLHDAMIPIASTLALLSCFYITVFVLKSKLLLLKFLSVICLLLFYGCIYVYYTRNGLGYLPVMQKTALLVDVIWVLSLEYFSKKEDFQVAISAKAN